MTLILLGLFSISAFAQNSEPRTQEELLEEFMRQRREMMKSMMDMMNEAFEEDDFFRMDDSFGMPQSLKGTGENVSVEEKYEDDGSITILIKPQSKNVNLDIKTQDNRITISSEIRQETTGDENGSSFSSYSMSSSTKSIGIPEGYQAKNPEAIEGAIKISLVPNKKIKDASPLNKKRSEKKRRNLLKNDADMI